MKKRFNVKEIAVIIFGTAIIAIAVYFFMMPSNLTVGSITAVAHVISQFVPLQTSVITLTLNSILLLLSLILIGKEFAAKTALGALLMPAFLGVFEIVFPNFTSLTQDATLDLVCYILLVGIGQAILFSYNASTGGLEIVAKIMNKFLRMDLGKALSSSGMVIALSAALCFDTKTVVLSVLGTYFGGLLVDKFIFGINLKRRVCIISAKTDEIVDFILHTLHSGASLYDMIGAYDNTVRREINVIVDKQEYRMLMEYLRKTDPKAFITVYSVGEMRYTPKK